jgi:hypothetical protein
MVCVSQGLSIRVGVREHVAGASARRTGETYMDRQSLLASEVSSSLLGPLHSSGSRGACWRKNCTTAFTLAWALGTAAPLLLLISRSACAENHNERWASKLTKLIAKRKRGVGRIKNIRRTDSRLVILRQSHG